MIRKIRIAIARRAWRKAAQAARAYNNPRNRLWNVRIQLAYDTAECAAANHLARLIDPRAILREDVPADVLQWLADLPDADKPLPGAWGRD